MAFTTKGKTTIVEEETHKTESSDDEDSGTVGRLRV